MALDLMDDEELTAARADELEAQEAQGLPSTMSTNPLQMGPRGSAITGNPSIPYGESRPSVPTAPGDAWWIEKPSQVDNRIDYDARNRKEDIKEILRAASFKDANKAIEQAMRMEGQFGFDADIKAGVPVMDALRKWGGKLSYNNPGALASMMGKIAASKEAPFIPSSKTVDGQKMFQMSPNRFAFPPNTPDGFQPKTVEVDGQKLLQTGPHQFRETGKQEGKDAAAYKRVQKENIIAEAKSLQHSLDTDVMNKEKRAALAAQIAELRQKAASIYAPQSKSTNAAKRLIFRDGKLVPRE